MRPFPNSKLSNGTAEAANGDVDKTILATPGANKLLRVNKAIVTVIVSSVGAGGRVGLEDGVGGTRIFDVNADSTAVYQLDFGDEGYPLTANTVLNLTVDGAATTQATARCTATGYVIG